MRSGWKRTEAARQNHGCLMSGLTAQPNWIMRVCRRIVVGSKNWRTSLSCRRKSMKNARECSVRAIKTFADWLESDWCRTIPGSPGKYMRVLLRARCRHFQRRCVASWCVIAVPPEWNDAGLKRPRVVCAGDGGVRDDAQRGSRGRVKSGFYQKTWGGKNDEKVA